MTGPSDDGPSGIFDHLDDAAAPAPGRDVLTSVVHRGRRIRARRQGAFALTGAAAVTAAVLGGLGISHAVDAGRGHDTVIIPAVTPTPAASASGRATHHHEPGVAVLVPGAGPATGAASPSASAAPPCGEPSASPSPVLVGPIVQSSVPPLFPTASPDPCASGSPTPSPSGTTSPTPEPSTTGEPTSSPGVPVPSEPATR
ncbi:MAG TPA: hypothetical protein VH274_02020 [Mycobacteriales bacterium]|nr:hypothetical protein [Mycobacteriales bacterium]